MTGQSRWVTRLHGSSTHLRQVEAHLIETRAHLSLEEQKRLVIPQLWSETRLAATRTTYAYKLLNTPFRNYGYTNVPAVGAMMKHRELHSELDRAAWEERYFTEVLSYQSFVQLAIKARRQVLRDYAPRLSPSARKVLRDYLTTEFALNALYIRLIVQTDEGFQTEKLADEMLEAKGIEVRMPTPEEESKHHLDRVGKQGWQIKNLLFATPARGNEGFRADQLANLRAQLKWETETGRQVFYLFEEDLAQGFFNPVGLPEVAQRCGLLDELFPSPIAA